MTDTIEELERLLAAATPGKWETFSHSLDGPAWSAFVRVGVDNEDQWLVFSCGESPAEADEQIADAALIVALRNAAPSLLASLKAITAERDEALRKALDFDGAKEARDYWQNACFEMVKTLNLVQENCEASASTYEARVKMIHQVVTKAMESSK